MTVKSTSAHRGAPGRPWRSGRHDGASGCGALISAAAISRLSLSWWAVSVRVSASASARVPAGGVRWALGLCVVSQGSRPSPHRGRRQSPVQQPVCDQSWPDRRGDDASGGMMPRQASPTITPSSVTTLFLWREACTTWRERCGPGESWSCLFVIQHEKTCCFRLGSLLEPSCYAHQDSAKWPRTGASFGNILACGDELQREDCMGWRSRNGG